MEENKPKVLIIYNKIWSYRIDIFDLLSEKYDLTVSYVDPSFQDREFSFKTLYLPIKEIGPLSFHTNNLFNLCKKFDVVIGIGQIRWISVMLLGMNPFRKNKLIYWGIGVRASYDHRFDEKSRVDRIRFFFKKKADALIFYSSYPIKKYVNEGFNINKLFVANNTVSAPFNADLVFDRKQILFIGTLYAAKGIQMLLDAYQQLTEDGAKLLPLVIVGGGEGIKSIKAWVELKGLEKAIEILGPIYDKVKLEEIFRSSVACISPNQAGLAVLSSMAYGCVFITTKNAITGGESLNIKDNETGVFYDGTIEDLKSKILFLHNNPKETSAIGEKAFKHYRENRSPENMANSIIEAIEFTLK